MFEDNFLDLEPMRQYPVGDADVNQEFSRWSGPDPNALGSPVSRFVTEESDSLLELSSTNTFIVGMNVLNKSVKPFTFHPNNAFKLKSSDFIAAMMRAKTAHRSAKIDSKTKNLQFYLAINGSFSPSNMTLDIWRKSVEELKGAHIEFDVNLKEINEDELKSQFQKSLSSLIARIAQGLRTYKSEIYYFFSNGRFVPSFQIEICERFLIVPDYSAEFLRSLSNDIVQNIQAGATIQGSWGFLEVIGSTSIRLNLRPKTKKTDGMRYQRAERLE